MTLPFSASAGLGTTHDLLAGHARPADMSQALMALDSLRAALATVGTVQDAKHVRDRAEALRQVAMRVGAGLEAQNACAELKLRAERLGGELLGGDDRLGRGGDRRTTGSVLVDYGLDATQSSRWQTIARIPSERFEGYIAQKDAGAELTTAGLLSLSRNGHQAVHYSSESPEWYTPSEIVERVVSTLGAIDLDPCSNPGDPNVPATQHFTEAEDGLSRLWYGRIYMNPPYGRVIGDWVEKLAVEYEAERVSAAIALVPARTDTAWFRRLPAIYVCFVTGRLEFSDVGVGAPFPSALFFLGTRPEAFLGAFADYGLLYARVP